MGNTDSIPIISQAKSLVQFAGGDSDGARLTQENFAYRNTFPVISQIASAGYYFNGEEDKALDLQKKFADDMQRVIDSIPVAGHIKGGIHYALGEKEEGDNAMKAASRSTGVVAGGVAGFMAGGPVGAVAGGIAGGAAVDGAITGSEYMINGPEAKSSGYIEMGEKIKDAVEGRKEITVEEGFDMALLPVGDSLGGYGAGKIMSIGKPLGLATIRGGGAAVAKGGYNLLDDGIAANAAKGKPLSNPIIENGPSLNKAFLDNRANQLNPNHVKSGPGRPSGYKGLGTKTDLDNHANHLNPNNILFQRSHGIVTH